MDSKKTNKLYSHFGLALLFLAPLLLLPKGFIEMKYNLFEYPNLFLPFKCITFFGDGWMLLGTLVFVLVRLHFYKKRRNLKELYSFIFAALLMSIVVCVFKHYLLPDTLRPIAYFTSKNPTWDSSQFDIHFNTRHSFPSGHTATFATIGFFLMRFIKKKLYIKLLFVAIILVGFSRIFLFQHFVLDVFIGFYIGLFSVVTANQLTYFVFTKKKSARTFLVLNN